MRYEKQEIKSRTRLYYSIARFANGIKKIRMVSGYRIVAVGYLLIGILTMICFRKLKYYDYIINHTDYMIQGIMLIAIYIFAMFILIYLIGAPLSAWRINRQLKRIGLCNSIGDAPYLMHREKNKTNGTYSLRFLSLGIPLSKFSDGRDAIEAALNFTIVCIKQGLTRNEVVITGAYFKNSIGKTIIWSDEYICERDFELTCGRSLLGPYEIDLNNQPHMLLGGETGSGKTVLLKCLLWQAIQKDADVYICDFKGGVDFTGIWEEKATLILDSRKELLFQLELITHELLARKVKFRQMGANSIVEYNKSNPPKKRIIFACDEVAEILDKKGLEKDEKELANKIEGHLSMIARQGRAFGISLILATQRPDMQILTGQIKNNISCRIAGRCDNILSQIILDNTDAADIIPSTERGLFLTNDGLVIRGYNFDDTALIQNQMANKVEIN